MSVSGSDFADDDAEAGRVQILAEEVEQEPVADGTALGQQVGVVLVGLGQAHSQQGGAQRRHEDLGDARQEVYAGDDGQDDEPEPDERVDLLVDDVQRQHAHGVVFLNRSCIPFPTR